MHIQKLWYIPIMPSLLLGECFMAGSQDILKTYSAISGCAMKEIATRAAEKKPI